MKLGLEVGLVPGHIVLDGEPPKSKATGNSCSGIFGNSRSGIHGVFREFPEIDLRSLKFPAGIPGNFKDFPKMSFFSGF